MKKNVLVLFLALLSCSCKERTFNSKEELMDYITDPENGYVQHKSINGIDISILYRPTDLLVQQMMSENASEYEIDSLRSKYMNYLYINLSLSKNKQEILSSMANADFGTLVNQLAFGMSSKVHFIGRSRDTLELLDYNYPRMYGMSGSTSMILVYPRDEKMMKEEYVKITIEDIGLNTGEVGFKIPTIWFQDEPKLHL